MPQPSEPFAERRPMSEEEARSFLASECKKAGGQRIWALAHCVSPSYVCDAIAGRRAIGEGLAEALGLDRSLTFTLKSEAAR
jgi:hypothetical protein